MLKRVTLPAGVRQCSKNVLVVGSLTTEMTSGVLHMPKRLPTLSLHKATGQARVWFNGRDHYLGNYGSQESLRRYAELVGGQDSASPVNPHRPATSESVGPTVHVIANLFLRHAESYYVKNGKQTAEVDCIRSAMGHLCLMFGDLPAKDFGPLSLKAVREQMVRSKGKKTKKPLCRDFINKSMERIRRIFKYAVENELVPASVLVGLQTVRALEAGRSDAPDYVPRSALPQDQIDAVKKKVNQRTEDMMDLAILTAARPGELVVLTGEMIDRTGDVWHAEIIDHKMSHKGSRRFLTFGPKAQVILEKYLPSDPKQRLFPIGRKTFSDNIKRACVSLGITQFTGHWLRHCSATAIRKSHGLDATQAVCGHASRTTTERYASPVSEQALQVARERG